MIKIQNGIFCKSLIYISLVVTALVPVFVYATVMSSESYQMGTNAIGSGIFESQSSANYTVEYPWQDTTTVLSEETITTVIGGGILGGISTSIPTHINAFNVPLVITEKQSGTLTYDLPDDLDIKIEVPKKITPKGITIIIKVEKESISNEYLIPSESNLIGNIFYNITAMDSNRNFVKQFDKYITITFKIPNSLIDVKDLGIYFLDENIGKWVIIPDIVFDGTTITFDVNHLTKFAILGRREVLGDIDFLIPQKIPSILEIPFIENFAEKIEIKKTDIIKPEGPKRIEQLFDNNLEIDNVRVVKIKEDQQLFTWKNWLFFLILIIIVWYLGFRKK